jgi:hypothetical protein
MTVSSPLGKLRSDPQHLVLIDERTGEEVGRCSGFYWKTVAHDDGTARRDARYSFNKGTQDAELKGPVKKIGFVQDWNGKLAQAQRDELSRMTELLAEANHDMQDLVADNKKLLQRLTAILRMMGGATTISETEMREAIEYGIEESWSPTNGTGLSLVEKA